MPSFFHSKIMTALLGLTCLWLAFIAIGAHMRHAAAGQNLAKVQDRIAADIRENQRLAQELGRMQQPAWLALIARERLNYKRPDETVVFVYKTQKADTIGQPEHEESRPHWQKWWDWLRGR